MPTKRIASLVVATCRVRCLTKRIASIWSPNRWKIAIRRKIRHTIRPCRILILTRFLPMNRFRGPSDSGANVKRWCQRWFKRCLALSPGKILTLEAVAAAMEVVAIWWHCDRAELSRPLGVAERIVPPRTNGLRAHHPFSRWSFLRTPQCWVSRRMSLSHPKRRFLLKGVWNCTRG